MILPQWANGLIAEGMHYAPLAVALVFLAFCRRREIGPAFFIVCAGFLVSMLADTVWFQAEVTRYYPALQLGLFALAFGVQWVPLALVMLAAVSVSPTVTIVGSACVLLYASGTLSPTMWVYCGLGTLLYVGKSLYPASYGMAYGYLATRAIAYGVFVWTVYREPLRAT